MFGRNDKTEALLKGALFGLQRNGRASLLRKYRACFKQRGSTNLCSAQRDLYGSSLCSSLKMTRLWRLMREIATPTARNDSAETREITTAIKNRLVMTSSVLALALVFCLMFICESMAGIKTYKCGDNCTATLDDEGVFTISGSGAMYDYDNAHYVNGAISPEYYSQPWAKDINEIKEVKFAENSTITSIGKLAFYKAENLNSINIASSVKTIGLRAFFNHNASSVILPDSITSIEEAALQSYSMDLIVLPDSIETMGHNSIAAPIYDETLPNIICRGNKQTCNNLINKLKNFKFWNPNLGGFDTIDLSSKVDYAKDDQCNDSKHYYTGSECTRRPTDGSSLTCVNGYALVANKCKDCTALGQVEYNGECLDEYPFSRKHWTPSEAAKWLKEDDNDVILTFKN